MSFKHKTLALFVAHACCTSALAENAATTLEPIVVSELSHTTLNLDQNKLEKESPKDLKAIFTTTPNINVIHTGHAQLGDIEIRGMGSSREIFATGANRVTMELDGMDISPSFYFGHSSRHGRQYFDPSDLKRVEIHKGPNSQGVAGHVRFQTKDPRDYLLPNQRTGAQLRAGYLGDSDAYYVGITGATLLDEHSSALVSYTRRWFNEFNNKGGLDVTGSQRTKSNPSSGYSNAVNSKLRYSPNDRHKFTLNATLYDLKRTAYLEDSLGTTTTRRGTKTVHHNTNIQKNQRHAIAFSHDMQQTTAFFDHLHWQIALQQTKSTSRNTGAVTSTSAPPPPSTPKFSQERSFDGFKTKTISLKTEFNKSLGQHVVHELHYGLKLQYSQMQALRQTQSLNEQGSNTRTSAFFPTQQQWQSKFHLSDRISFGKSGLSLTPSIHLTQIRIKPKTENVSKKNREQLFTYKDTAIGYGLRVDYALNEANLLSLNYQHATRLPGYGENNAQSYGHWPAKPNPHLQPETSDGVELSWRSAGAIGQQTTTLFYNRYNDLIYLDTTACYADRTGQVPCDLANEKGRSYSYGIEFDGKLNLDTIGFAQGTYLNAGFAYSKGKTANKQPQGRLDPLTGFVGLGYQQPMDVWGIEGKLKFAAKKKTKDLPANQGFEGLPGYAVVDLTAYYNVTKQLYLGIGIYNVLDKKYARWAMARGDIKHGNYDKHTEAGRHFGANIRYHF
ncbi:TonB-dependent receptor domain-containing protein [Pasteurella multocida]|uniref:TonB-dependent receptor domain-containing protein n=2 Tax=Pasteurella multocida TaxID=747 RepID=UPI000C7D6A50|nr:TonB-dependent receptor [Pasteurella multocida]AUK37034.1 ligand-gated channel [Pasteurella multocida]